MANAGTFKKGEKRPGQGARGKNKTTLAAKEAIEHVFNELGGAKALQEWAQREPANERVFYGQIWPKILPKEIKADVTHRGWFNVLAGLGTDKADD